MDTHYPEAISSVARKMLGYVLRELDLAEPQPASGGHGMPDPTVFIESRGIVLATTPVDAPMFREQMERLATELYYDVMLVRTGLSPEVLNPVSVDVALGLGPNEMFVMRDLAFYRQYDTRELWLVPEGLGPCIAIRPSGLELEMVPPHGCMDERSDGTCRAAREIVLFNRAIGTR